jgi:hypothetical protein
MDPSPERQDEAEEAAKRQDEAEDAARKIAVYQGLGCVGCGSLIFLVFSMLAYTVWRADSLFSSDPEAVVATLQRVVPCDVPEGFRGFQSTESPNLRLAILGPASYEGQVLKVDVPLLISAWAWPGQSGEAEARRDEVIEFWKGRALQRLNEEVDDVKTTVDSVQLEIRGQRVAATESLIACKSETLRVVTAVVAGSGDNEWVVLSFMGTHDTFDEEAMKTFLSSVR